MELPQVGKHCQLEGCNSLDFLPIACQLCQKTFCGDHRLAHGCSQRVDIQILQCSVCEQFIKPPENQNVQEALTQHKEASCQLYLLQPLEKINRACTIKGCNDIDPRIGPVHCNGCDQDFCLRHRHASTHSCISLNVEEQKKMDRKLAAQEKLSKTFVPIKNTKKVSKPVPVKNSMVELMKIKSQAKGVGSVPISSRLYVYVQCPKEAKVSNLVLYLDKKNTVGKSLDMIADLCQVNNSNNVLAMTDPKRLELYKCPEMTVLNKADSLESTLENLDTILLERQGVINK